MAPLLIRDVENTSLIYALNRRRKHWLLEETVEVDGKEVKKSMIRKEKEEEEEEEVDEQLVTALYSDKTGVLNNPSSFIYRKLDNSEMSHASFSRLHTLPAFQPGKLAVTPTLQQFLFNLEIFSYGVLKGIDWNGVILGGSAPMACLQPLPSRLQSCLELWMDMENAVDSLSLPPLALVLFSFLFFSS